MGEIFSVWCHCDSSAALLGTDTSKCQSFLQLSQPAYMPSFSIMMFSRYRCHFLPINFVPITPIFSRLIIICQLFWGPEFTICIRQRKGPQHSEKLETATNKSKGKQILLPHLLLPSHTIATFGMFDSLVNQSFKLKFHNQLIGYLHQLSHGPALNHISTPIESESHIFPSK